jgi:hypothetical protein
MGIKKNIKDLPSFNKTESLFNTSDRTLDVKTKVTSMSKSFKNLNINSNINSLPLSISNFFLVPSNINLVNFNYLCNDSNYEMLEENYENIKNFKFIYYLFYQNLNFSSLNFLPVSSYTTVLDAFRADFDENN